MKKLVINNLFILVKATVITLIFTHLSFVGFSQKVHIQNKYYQLSLNESTGSIASFKIKNREFIGKNNLNQPLFNLLLMNDKGEKTIVSSLDCISYQCVTNTENKTVLKYTSLKRLLLNATVVITYDKKSPFTYWRLLIDNHTKLTIDHLDFPNVTVPNDMIGTGGDSYIFKPNLEGVVIDDFSKGIKTWMNPGALEYPNNGFSSYYPAACSLQFMAYYNNTAGLYFAAHDKGLNFKGLEAYPLKDNTVRLSIRLFPSGTAKNEYRMPYQIVLGCFKGDWYDAADIYRKWHTNSKVVKGPKLINNKRLPNWFRESPVIVTYPVRGTKDTGDMKPNEYYPFTNALSVIDTLSNKLNSKILALLMHWEGSAPWAPPYVWPPYGGKDNYLLFVNALHKKGNLAGLYASGTGYTLLSHTDTSYNMYREYKDENLKNVMTIAPDGQLATNGICTGRYSQRDGYDMCPSQKFVQDVVVGQIDNIIKSNTDYVQYFDQNIGGNCYMCYSKYHNHPAGPGKWQSEVMIKLYKRLQQLVDYSGKKMLVGCEGAAAEPFQPYLLFNDLRYNVNYTLGKPVPAYSYIFHEYINNFMGNQVTATDGIDMGKSPLNMNQRVSLAFIGGNMFTIVLQEKANASWCWGYPWHKSKPDQPALFSLINNLNQWRKGIAKSFLLYGRMEKPFKISGFYDIPMIAPHGDTTHYESVFTSCWSNKQGKKMQIVVNYTKQLQTCKVHVPALRGHIVSIYFKSNAKPFHYKINSSGTVYLKINPLDAAMIAL